MGDSPGNRLTLFRKSLGISQRALSGKLGYSDSLVGLIEAGKTDASQSFIRSIATTYGVSSDWLLYGAGDMLMPRDGGFLGASGTVRIDPPNPGKPMHGAFLMDGVEYVRVRRLALDVSAGNGLGPAEDGASEAIALPRDWMIRQRLAADLCVLVTLRGDSMAPAIPDGAFLLLNAAERDVRSPGIYAVTRNGEAYAKRLAVTSSGPDGRPTGIVLMSDNPAFPPVSLAGADLDSLVIVGRVRGVFAFF